MIGRELAAWWSAIWPNLVASALWAAPAFAHLHMRLNRQHDRIRAELKRPVRGRALVPDERDVSTPTRLRDSNG